MKQFIAGWHEKMFNRIHQSNLIYNTCWEDPRCDRSLMDFNEDSNIVMLTSAGCNALDYLLDKPVSIHCVDMNHRQNALLELKIALFKNGCRDTLYQFFRDGGFKGAGFVYVKHLRNYMPVYAQAYWDKKITYFEREGLRKSFYYRGTSGALAFVLKQYFDLYPGLKRKLDLMLDARNLEEQTAIYNQLEGQIFSKAFHWFANSKTILSLAGVPGSQRDMLLKQYPGGAGAYIKDCFRTVFTEIPIRENYFYLVYLTGKYEDGIYPNYLMDEHFEVLTEKVHNIRTHTLALSTFLKTNPGEYTHFVLLDHQDWLAAHRPDLLKEEWQLILENAAPDCKILMRSAMRDIDFFPEIVNDKVKFKTEHAGYSLHTDRVGTYAGTYLGEIRA